MEGKRLSRTRISIGTSIFQVYYDLGLTALQHHFPSKKSGDYLKEKWRLQESSINLFWCALHHGFSEISLLQENIKFNWKNITHLSLIFEKEQERHLY